MKPLKQKKKGNENKWTLLSGVRTFAVNNNKHGNGSSLMNAPKIITGVSRRWEISIRLKILNALIYVFAWVAKIYYLCFCDWNSRCKGWLLCYNSNCYNNGIRIIFKLIPVTVSLFSSAISLLRWKTSDYFCFFLEPLRHCFELSDIEMWLWIGFRMQRPIYTAWHFCIIEKCAIMYRKIWNNVNNNNNNNI